MIFKTFDHYPVETLTDRQLAGQKLMVGFNGLQWNEDLKFLIGTLKVGGLILFAGNVSTSEQIRQLCHCIQQYAQKCDQPPLWIAIDQEGGQVARLKAPFFTEFPGNPAMQSPADAIRFARITAQELKKTGINMNMAPVLDVGSAEQESIMAKRVFGNDPNWVTDMGVTVIKHLQDNHVTAVAKHFPGIGRTTLDSHLHLPILKTDQQTLEKTDWVPFKAAIKANVAGIMLSHILYPSLDPQWPASLSAVIANNILRCQMGYQGIVITDDLDMKAIQHDMPTIIRRIITAGIDIALICHKGPKIEIAYQTFLKEIKDNHRFRMNIKTSVRRILDQKQRYLSHCFTDTV
jgi:beta-N-acetylhexosaminidase